VVVAVELRLLQVQEEVVLVVLQYLVVNHSLHVQ
jgi:hypothetical protein